MTLTTPEKTKSLEMSAISEHQPVAELLAEWDTLKNINEHQEQPSDVVEPSNGSLIVPGTPLMRHMPCFVSLSPQSLGKRSNGITVQATLFSGT